MCNESEEYMGIQREKIPWHPTINYAKCEFCGTCVEYCKLGVYRIVEENRKKRAIVKNHNNCIVFCTGCISKCPTGAISFPSKQRIREIIKELKKDI